VPATAISPDGNTLASAGDDKRIVLWDLGSKRVVAELQGHPTRIGCLRFANDGRWLASGGDSHAVRVWRPQRFPNWSAIELIQCRFPVGGGPSSNTWPRWPPHREHAASTAPRSGRVETAPGRDSRKEGHPHASYLVLES